MNCIFFGAKSIKENEVKGKKVIEVGSYNVNGSLRQLIESWKPSKYVGVDIERGPGVDDVCSAEDIVEKFGRNSFDIVISTELMEHVRDWRKAVSNMKNICRPGGIILITTRSKGFKYHGYPNDFWRYQSDDMRSIFSDCDIVSVEKDLSAPGVFMKARKPKKFREKDISNHKLYSIVTDKKTAEIRGSDLRNLRFRVMLFKFRLRGIIAKTIKSVIYRS